MQLHHQAVFERHASELHEHVRPEDLAFRRSHLAAQRALVYSRSIVRYADPRGRVTMVGGGRAVFDEDFTSLAQRFQVPGKCRRVTAGDLAEAGHPVGPAEPVEVDDVVGTERGDDPAEPAVGGQLLVARKVIQRRLGGGEHLQVEPAEQRPRPEFGLGELLR